VSQETRNLSAKHFIPSGTAVAAISNSAATLLAASNVAGIGALNSRQSNFSWLFYVFNKDPTNDVHVNVYNGSDTGSGTHVATLGDRVVPPKTAGYFQVPEGGAQGLASLIADTAACNVVTGWMIRSKT
jgi:hypothetical protein